MKRQARRQQKYVRIAGGRYTTTKQALRYIADGRATLKANGELEFIASDPKHQTVVERIRQPPDLPTGSHFHWQKKNSDGMRVWTGRAVLKPDTLR